MRYPTSTECDTQPVQSAFANPVNSKSVASKKVKVFTTVFRRKNRLSGADARGASRVFQSKRSFLMFPLPRSLYPLIFSTLYPFSSFLFRAPCVCYLFLPRVRPLSRLTEWGARVVLLRRSSFVCRVVSPTAGTRCSHASNKWKHWPRLSSRRCRLSTTTQSVVSWRYLQGGADPRPLRPPPRPLHHVHPCSM